MVGRSLSMPKRNPESGGCIGGRTLLRVSSGEDGPRPKHTQVGLRRQQLAARSPANSKVASRMRATFAPQSIPVDTTGTGVRTEIPGLADRRCGDGAVFTGEGCDDKNTSSGDGCSEFCQVETGWKCTGEPSWCRPPVRGEDCLDPIPLKAPAHFAGSLQGLVNDYDPDRHDCTKTWATGGDAVFAVTVPAGAAVDVTATSDADLVLYTSTECAELLANCFVASDVNLGGNPESITLDNLEGAEVLEVFVVVDSYVEEREPFTLELTFR